MILREKAYKKIKDRIVSGYYQPGQPLNEKEIIDEFQISRTPFREAVHALAEENLVQIFPNRGVFVRELTLQDILNGFDIRSLLDPYVVRLAASRMPKSAIRKLIEQIDLIEKDKKNYNGLLNEDDHFHYELLQFTENRQLIRIMKNLYEFNRYQVILMDEIKNGGVSQHRLSGAIESLAEHRVVLVHMLNGETDQAAEAMQMHILNARKRILQ